MQGESTSYESSANQTVLKGYGLAALDLPTQDKIPPVQRLMMADKGGLALDIGAGLGYTTRSVFADRPTVCVDLNEANLHYLRDRVAAVASARPPLCVVARAAALPFRAGAFQYILCSEVLEHIEDDDSAAEEIARVLADDGRGVITVPYTGIGLTSFLAALKIKTVHDYPGPEHHVRAGYDERSLVRLLSAHGLEVAEFAFYFRFFTRLTTDGISLFHLMYQRLLRHRTAWNWSDVAADEDSLTMRVYGRIFPLLASARRLDKWLAQRRGFGLVAAFHHPVTKDRASE